MEGTPLGDWKRRGAGAGIGVALAAGALAAGEARADTFVVRTVAEQGHASFATAVRRANADRDRDEVRFGRALKGTIELPPQLEVEQPLELIGNGYGSRGERFRDVVLRGRRRGSEIVFTEGGADKGLLRELYLDRVRVSSLGSAFTVRDSTITGRRTVDEVGVYSYFGYNDPTRIVDSTVRGFAIGVVGYRSDVVVERSTVVANRGGGGTFASGYVTDVEVRDSTIAGNSGPGGGASVYEPADMSIVNSTISGNRATGERAIAGGISGGVRVNETTVTGNTAELAGGISPGNYGYEMVVSNSIIAGNSSLDPAQGDDCASTGTYGDFDSRGGNLIESPGSCEWTGRDTVGRRPEIGRLRDNGGTTRTHALLQGSPAIGAAVKKTATGRDQRGAKRDRSPDSGAFER